MPAAAPPATPRNIRLDVLRGVAVLLVMFHHQPGSLETRNALTGGWLGVDLFYALSGFLIVTLMLAEHANSGRVSRAGFAVRRAKRLLPALLALAVVWVAAAVTFPDSAVTFSYAPKNETLIPATVAATFGGYTNWWLLSMNQYPAILGHLWSLAVEWQFYLAAAIALPLLLRFDLRRTHLAAIAIVSIAAATVIQVLVTTETTTYTGYLNTVGRIPAIAMGALAAIALSAAWDRRWNLPPRLAWVAVTVLTVALGGMWLLADKTSFTIIAYGVPAAGILSGALLWAALSAPAFPVRIPAVTRVLAWCGRKSYSAYLWNWPIVTLCAVPIMEWADTRDLPAGTFLALAVCFTLTWVFATASWHLIEKRWISR